MLPRGKLIYPLCFPFNFNSDTDYLARIHRPHFCWAKARFLIIERKTPQRCQTWHMGGLQVLYNTKPRSNLVRPKQGYWPAKTFLVRWVLRRSRAEPHYSGDQSVLDHVVVTVVNWPRGPGKKQYNWTEVKQENDGRGAGGGGAVVEVREKNHLHSTAWGFQLLNCLYFYVFELAFPWLLLQNSSDNWHMDKCFPCFKPCTSNFSFPLNIVDKGLAR